MDIQCSCGGTLKPARLTQLDLNEYLGIKGVVEEVHGLRCHRCGWETLPGPTIEQVMNAVAAELVEQGVRLGAEWTRYLRKYLGLTQAELARRMGITRKTVNQWETGAPISPQHDFILRALVMSELPEGARPRALDRVRTAPPKARKALVVARLGRVA